MKIIIGQHGVSISDKITIVARRVRMDRGEQGKKGFRMGKASNELAATVDGRKKPRDIVRMKTADCMLENLEWFAEKSAREIIVRAKALNGVEKLDHDTCVSIKAEDPIDAYKEFALAIKRSKHYEAI